MFLWRYRDDKKDEWRYSEVPVNPESWVYLETFELKYKWLDGERHVSK